MRVGGGSSLMSHLAGMSSLWHDAEYKPDRAIHVPTVVPRFAQDDERLPSEQHQLPKGAAAFAKLDEMYEAAGRQMERGIEGAAFLHGKPPVSSLDRSAPSRDAVAEAQDMTRTFAQTRGLDPDRRVDTRAVQEGKAADEQIARRAAAGSAPTQASKATDSADSRQSSAKAAKTLEMAEGLGITMAGLAATKALDPVGSSLIAEAASLVKAVSTAKTAVGMTKSMDEMPGTSKSEHLRRGLGKRPKAVFDESDADE
jgi:hypothetical protein